MPTKQLTLFPMDEKEEEMVCEQCGEVKDKPNGTSYCNNCKE